MKKKTKNQFLIECKCGSKNIRFELMHDWACGDPDCCGERHYYGFRIICKDCGFKQDIYCQDEL